METTLELNEEQIVALTELLLGAAHADDEFHALEKQRIKELVKPYIQDRDLADRVARRLLNFDPVEFAVEKAAETLDVADARQRGAVLAMVADVIDADFVHDFAESDYLESVADALGAAPEEFEQHTVEVVELGE